MSKVKAKYIDYDPNTLESNAEGKLAVRNSGNTSVYNETPTGTINGVNTDFTLVNTPASNSVRVYLEGKRLAPGVDYSITSSIISFVLAPLTGSIILVDYNY